MDTDMNKKSIFSALAFMCLTVLGLVGCKQEEFNTDQLSDSQVKLVGIAPNPVARGGALRLMVATFRMYSRWKFLVLSLLQILKS